VFSLAACERQQAKGRFEETRSEWGAPLLLPHSDDRLGLDGMGARRLALGRRLFGAVALRNSGRAFELFDSAARSRLRGSRTPGPDRLNLRNWVCPVSRFSGRALDAGQEALGR